MKHSILRFSACLIGLYACSVHSLTINGSAKNSTLKVCFDEVEIMKVVPDLTELNQKKKWVRDAVEKESWEYYTNLNFTGWKSCAETPDYDIKIISGGAWSSGDTIAIPFYNKDNLPFERYHIVSATVHEIGHQLRFPHEQNRLDSPLYTDAGGNQKFRFTKTNGSAFSSGTGPFQIRVEDGIEISEDDIRAACLTVSKTSPYPVTQTPCSSTNTNQQFTLATNSNMDFSNWPKASTKWLNPSYNPTWANIKSVGRSNTCLDIRGGSTDSGARLITWSCSLGASNQSFAAMQYGYTTGLKKTTAGAVYGLQVSHSRLWLDAMGGDRKDGAELGQWSAYFEDYRYLTLTYDRTSVMSYGNNQRPSSYILRPTDIQASRIIYGNSGKNTLSEFIIAKPSGKCLKHNTSGSDKLIQETCNETTKAQQFRISWLSTEEFRILDDNNGKCLAANDGELVFEDCAKESASKDIIAQRFTMPEGEAALWKTIRSHEGDCLDLAWADTSNGAPFVLWGCHSAGNNDNQLFKIKPGCTEITNNINIGMSCNSSSQCGEAFGRTCASITNYQGVTKWINGRFECHINSCQW